MRTAEKSGSGAPRKLRLVLFAAVSAGALSGCTVGPNYHRPAAPVPATWDVQQPWRPSTPNDGIPKGKWWSVFQENELDDLEKQALDANQTIKVSQARLAQARATAAVQVASIFPTLGLSPSTNNPSLQRSKLSGSRPQVSSVPVTSSVTQNNFGVPFAASYEVDLFGRRRRSIESAQALYQASAADLENVRLLVSAQLAGNYFTLRQQDTQIAILNRTVEALQKGLDLVNSRHDGGIASGLDVAQEETLLRTAQTQATLLRQQRKNSEDAIALLIGKPAPDFHLAAKELTGAVPPIDLGVPSDLLERRPDVAESERNMAAANAQIGVAEAAYYPTLDLFAGGGFESAAISKIANASSIYWAIGADVAETIFSGGARRAQVQYAKAGFDANVATYRETVLNAFREVQDDITALTVLDLAQQSQQQVIDAAKRTLDISTERYQGGLVSYLDVVTAQQNYLNSQTELASIRGQRLIISVMLVQALGGGWDASSLAALHVNSRARDIVTP